MSSVDKCICMVPCIFRNGCVILPACSSSVVNQCQCASLHLCVCVCVCVCVLPELQHTGDVARGEDPSNVVEVAYVQAAVRATCQRHRSQQLVAVRQAVTAGAGNAPPPSVTHDAPNHRGLLGNEHILAVAFVEDACVCWEIQKQRGRDGEGRREFITRSCF